MAFLVYRRVMTRDYYKGVDPRVPHVPGTDGFLGCLPIMIRDKDPYVVFKNFADNEGSPCITHILGTLHVVAGTPEQAKEILTSVSARNKGLGGYDELLRFLGKESLIGLPYDAWVPLRKTFAGVFHLKFMKEYFSVFVASSKVLVDAIERESAARAKYYEAAQAAGKKVEAVTFLKPVNMDSLGMNFALDVVTRALFSKDLNIQKGGSPEIIVNLEKVVHLFGEVLRNPLYHLMHPFKNMEYRRLIRWFHGLSLAFIEERRKDPSIQKNDLLGLMLAATNPDTGKMLTTAEILSQCTTFYFAGHDTTGHTLAWVMHEISHHPEVEERIHEELTAVLGDDDAPTFEQVNRLTYIQWVVKETLRMHPPVGNSNRRFGADTTVGGITFPADSEIVISVLSIHSSEKVWAEPWRFRPERFSDQESEGRHPYAWMPFGAGERNCIGMNFALLELRTAVAAICKKFLVRPTMTHLPHAMAFITSVPVDGIYLNFFKREGEHTSK